MEAALLFSDGYELKSCRTEVSRNIPDEVLFVEILVLLPVKSLTMYKCVCKKWLHTIESRSFRDAHRRRHIRYFSDEIMFSPFKSVSDPVTRSSSLLPSTHSFGPGLIKMTSRPLDEMLPPEMTRINWPDVELDEPDVAAGVRYWDVSVCVLGPVRSTGIYCVVAYLVPGNLHPVPDPFFPWMYHCFPNVKISICNPATREYKLANPFPPEEMGRLQLTGNGDRNFSVCYGFGVAADGDYKVVVIIDRSPRYTVFLSYVYSLKQGLWKKIVDAEAAMVSRIDLQGKPDFPQVGRRGELCPQALLNSCWHWMACFSDLTSSVMSFHLDNEVFKLVRGPPSYRGTDARNYEDRNQWTSGVVSVLNDHLTMLYYTTCLRSPTDISGVCSVWMMMEYGDEESWINVWTVNLKYGSIFGVFGISYSLREDGDGNGGIHIDRILLLGCGRCLLSCDEFGAVDEQPDYETTSCIYWNNLGISAYSDTLQPLIIQDSSDVADTFEV